MDFRVYTQPGADWNNTGHGFAWKSINWAYNSITSYSQSYAGLVVNPVQIRVANQTQQRDLILGRDYVVDWVNNIVTLTNNPNNPAANNGNVVVISAFGIGGGNQLYKNSYLGSDIGNSVTIPVAYSQIEITAIFVNGVLVSDYILYPENSPAWNNTTAYGAGAQVSYYSEKNIYVAVFSPPVGTPPTDTFYWAPKIGSVLSTTILFGNSWTSSDEVNITAIGSTDGSVASSWSTPQTQYFLSAGELEYRLDNSMSGTNIPNLVVEINGVRARPPEGAFYIADGSSGYALPNRGGYSLALVSDNDVLVYVNNEKLSLGSDYIVEPYTGSDTRYVDFTHPPSPGSQVLISVTTKADYVIYDDSSSIDNYILAFRTSGGFYPQYGHIVGVTSWNDTAQQSIATLLWQGPITTGIVENEPFDSTAFDVGTVSGGAGTFDYTQGVQINVNDFQLGRIVTDPTRMWVTKNGRRLFSNVDYTISGEQLILTAGAIGVTDVVVAELFTDSVVPEAMEFRIFQDMRGVQATYRMTPGTTTTLIQPLLASQDIIYVDDVTTLTQPNPAINIWGVITINGERIMYRELDTVTNTVSSLLRGTAGTATTDHDTGSIVYNIGRGNLAPAEYQDRVIYTNTLADGSTTTFSADNIDLSQLSLSFAQQAILVYVSGIRVYTGYTVDSVAPATVTFDTAPTAGYEVSIRVRQGFGWYQPANGNPSDGRALQVTQTDAARFFRGQN
jgi:hypothetical protein